MSLHPAIVSFLEEVELELKRMDGLAPEEALSELRAHLAAEVSSHAHEGPERTSAQWRRRFVSSLGEPWQVARDFAQAEPGRRVGHAPGWRIACSRCGRSTPLDRVPGAIRVGARSWHKYTLGWCSSCRRPRWLRLQRDMDRPRLTASLGARGTPEQLRARNRPWLVIAACLGVVAIVYLVLG